MGKKQSRYANRQQAHEKAPSILSLQRNVNQTHNKIPFHNHWDGIKNTVISADKKVKKLESSYTAGRIIK